MLIRLRVSMLPVITWYIIITLTANINIGSDDSVLSRRARTIPGKFIRLARTFCDIYFNIYVYFHFTLVQLSRQLLFWCDSFDLRSILIFKFLIRRFNHGRSRTWDGLLLSFLHPRESLFKFANLRDGVISPEYFARVIWHKTQLLWTPNIVYLCDNRMKAV